MEDEVLHLLMGEMTVVENGTKVKTTLGSCVGVILHDKLTKRSAIAHIMLPTRLRSDTVVGKYADTALPALLEELSRRGSAKKNLEAYMTGGAHLFGRSEDKRIATVGDMNVDATREILARHGIKVVFEETGGSRGRVVTFDNSASRIEVRTLKSPIFERRKA